MLSKKAKAEYELARYHKLRKQLVEYLGNKCTVCGVSTDLEIDHIDPLQKKFNVAKCWSIAWENVIIEVNKCQLLCEEHHKEKHEPKHGTYSKYKRGKCRCKACCEAHRLYWKIYNSTRIR